MARPGSSSRLRVVGTVTAALLVGGSAVAIAAARLQQPPTKDKAAATLSDSSPRPAAAATLPKPVPRVATSLVAAPPSRKPPSASAVTQAPAPAAPAVAPLSAVAAPDLLVRAPHSLTSAQQAALGRIPGLRALSVLDSGRIRVGATTVPAVGVDPSTLRPLTPRETATSDGLWASVARGDLAATFSRARTSQLPLGGPVTLAGVTTAASRLGAIAVFALPDADVVVNHDLGRRLGLTANTTVLLSAPSRGLSGLRAQVTRILPGGHLTTLRPAKIVASRPHSYRELYMSSARYCPGLSWTVLAAIGQVESGHGVNVGPSSAGALGPMQFLPSTWAVSGVDGDGDGKADILNAFDAVPAAALYLCQGGAGRGGQGLYDAIFSYNHADWYVREVLALSARYK